MQKISNRYKAYEWFEILQNLIAEDKKNNPGSTVSSRISHYM